MKKKLSIVVAGLLLAVGWTSSASAQLLPKYQANSAKERIERKEMKAVAPEVEQTVGKTLSNMQPKTVMSYAPQRTQNFDLDAKEVRTKEELDDLGNISWTDLQGNPQSTKLTDVYTDANGIIALLKEVYTNRYIPGAKYSAPRNADIPYQTIQHGWGINGTIYNDDATIEVSSNRVRISKIIIKDGQGNETLNATPSNGAVTMPSGWTDDGNYWYTTSSSGGTLSIPAELLQNNYGYAEVLVYCRPYSSAYDGVTITIGNEPYGYYTKELTYTSGYVTIIDYAFPGTITPPDDNGYTVALVKLNDGINTDSTDMAPQYTYSTQELRNYFTKYVKEVQLLTDGLRIGTGGDNPGTAFAYTGSLNRFFFISKGKLAYVTGSDRAPFYSMYEEFSPTTQSNTTGIDDFYAEMVGGNSYGIIHDCQSVNYMQHYFSMTGSTGTEEKSVAAMVFYIPDDRGSNPADSTGSKWRNYDHQPQVGLYTIHLAAETAPVASYSESNRQYDVFLDWTSSLNQMVSNTVPQTYVIYKVTFDDQGNRVYTYLDEVEDVTTYTYQEDQLQTSQTFTYVILGYPTNATNKPTVNAHGDIESGQFYTYSNLDDVQIPGWFDFMVLYRERYESDFVIPEEKNYYRNYLYPTNLAPGTGMTMGQLKQEWPNQTASYTLWRDNTGVAKLEVRAIGNKVYYRIRYYEGSQVTTGPNNINVPNYVEIPNENN